MAKNDFTQIDTTDFQDCLNDIKAVADALALLAPLVNDRDGLPGLSSAMYVLGDYLEIRSGYLLNVAGGNHA